MNDFQKALDKIANDSKYLHVHGCCDPDNVTRVVNNENKNNQVDTNESK